MSVASPVIDRLELSTKLIYLATGVREYHPVSDIYVEIRNLRRTDESLRVFDIPVTAFGAVPKGGGKYTSRYARFNHGWKVVPEDVSHSLYVTGEQITDDGQSGPACINTDVLSAGTSVIIQYEPPASELVKAEDEIAAIKRMAFNDRVAIDPENVTGKATTSLEFPAGTRQAPAADMDTAMAIAVLPSYGFKELFLESDLSITGTYDLGGFLIEGNNHVDTVLKIASSVVANNLRIRNCTVTDTTLDGDIDIADSTIGDITYFNGHIHDCGLFGTIILDGAKECVLANCYTVDQDAAAIVDMGSSGNDLAAPNYSGLLTIRNLTSADEEIGVGLNAGMVILEDTITAGTVIVAGNGLLMDNSTGTTNVNADGLMNKDTIARGVWDEPVANHLLMNTMGHQMYHQAYENSTVYVDINDGVAGTDFPTGTIHQPCVNLDDALTIATAHNFPRIWIIGDAEVDGQNLTGRIIGAARSTGNNLTITSMVNTGTCYFENITVGGALSGATRFTTCVLGTLTGFDGGAKNCLLTGDVTITGDGANYFTDCDSYVTGPSTKNISVGDKLLNIIRGEGLYTISDYTGTGTIVIDMASGNITIDSTCVSGIVVVSGPTQLVDNSGAGCYVFDATLSNVGAAEEVWTYERP